jgi:hypothetical protein
MIPRRFRAGKPEPVCPKCGFRTSLIPNPHYGVGLAVHRYLRSCGRCDWIAIVNDQPARLPEPPTATPVQVNVEHVKPTPVLGRFRKRPGNTTAQ